MNARHLAFPAAFFAVTETLVATLSEGSDGAGAAVFAAVSAFLLAAGLSAAWAEARENHPGP